LLLNAAAGDWQADDQKNIDRLIALAMAW